MSARSTSGLPPRRLVVIATRLCGRSRSRRAGSGRHRYDARKDPSASFPCAQGRRSTPEAVLSIDRVGSEYVCSHVRPDRHDRHIADHDVRRLAAHRTNNPDHGSGWCSRQEDTPREVGDPGSARIQRLSDPLQGSHLRLGVVATHPRTRFIPNAPISSKQKKSSLSLGR